MTVPSLKIGIAGISGRVGRLLAEEVIGAGFILAGGSARHPSSVKGLLANVPLFADFSALADASDVVIDFTHADTSARHAEILADYGKALVLGTTGLSPEQEAAVKAAAKKIAVVHAANFSPGVTLVRRLARMMGQALPAESYDVEIVEMHHRQKVDAPSGTALAIGESVADGRGVSLADVKDSGRDGHTGARKTGDIGFAAREMAADNKLLGNFDLTGIAPAPRGVPQIEVTFDIDANGIVSVSAKDKATGKEQQIKIQASGGLSDSDIDKMVKDAEANAAADKARREQVEARNSAESLVHQTEKALTEAGDKVPAADKEEAEAAVAAVKTALEGSDAEAIKTATERLTQASMKVGEAVYKASQAEGGAAPEAEAAKKEDENIVDADFEDVNDKKS